MTQADFIELIRGNGFKANSLFDFSAPQFEEGDPAFDFIVDFLNADFNACLCALCDAAELEINSDKVFGRRSVAQRLKQLRYVWGGVVVSDLSAHAETCLLLFSNGDSLEVTFSNGRAAKLSVDFSF